MDERERPDHDQGILDTVRRILSEDQGHSPEARSPEARPEPGVEARLAPDRSNAAADDDDVLELEPTMMIDQPSATSRPVDSERQLVGGQAEQDARQSLGSLRNLMREQRAPLTHRDGPSIEDIIREEIRPLLREWLDSNLPPLVERVVRSEIARIVDRDGA